MRWQFKLNTVAGAGTVRQIVSEYSSSSLRGWHWYLGNKPNLLTIRVGNSAGTGIAYDQVITGCTPTSGDFFDITFNSGVYTIVKNGTTTYTLDVSGTQIFIYNVGASLNVGGYLSGATLAFNGSLCCFKIWVDNILDTDTPKFVAPMGDKQGIDLISGTIPTVVGTVDMTARADDASYDCEENGFAVKTGKIYPKNYAGTGYAGLVGEPDAVYQGLIALKGGYDAEAQNYLKTKFSFTATDNTEIENAGLILDNYTALDCNDDLIYTADPYLDPLTYPNAFTAMTLANVSQQRYNNLADNNASRRIFIKYKKGTDVTDDGSRALITAGTVQEILVYKRDLTVAEAVKVLKYCNDFPMDNQVMVGNVPSVDVDDNFVFSCTGHTEPEIEIEEP